MRRARISITLKKDILSKVDEIVDQVVIKNRSQAFEFILTKYFGQKITTAVILAGGEGVNLRPFTYEQPKALLPLRGKPIIEHLIIGLKKAGINKIIIATGYKGEKIKQHLGEGEKFGVKIIYSQEKKPLQTGGALLKAKNFIKNESFVVVHGDLATDLAFEDIISFHLKEKALATLALTWAEDPEMFGQSKIHGVKLVDFFRKGISPKKGRSHLINCGIYVFEPEIYDFFPKNKNSFPLDEVIEKIISKKNVVGFVFEGQWFDVGSPKNYEKAIKEFKPSR